MTVRLLPLTGKGAIVTGASRGIGLAIAQLFAANGISRLLLVGRSKDTLEQAKDSISEANVEVHSGDVKDRTLWSTLGRRKDLWNTDILVNAAGIAHSSPLAATSPGLIEDVVQTNLMGAIWACQSIGKLMVRQRRPPEDTACIINVASVLGIKGGKGSAAYAASKAGVIGLTRALALELGPRNVRVNTILPGYIETSMTDHMAPEARAQALNSIPQNRFGTSAEVASCAVFLATNAYANNCVLNLDGGVSAT